MKSAADVARRSKHAQGDSCGCAMGARFLTVAFAASTAWYAWRWAAYGSSVGSFVLHVLIWSLIAAFVGKFAGIALFHFQRRRQA